MARLVAPALRALLGGLIDYAGSFPPASLSCQRAFENYQGYGESPQNWMLGRFVITAGDLDKLPHRSSGRLAVLTETDDGRADCIESKTLIRTKKPVYVECPAGNLTELREASAFAKIRTGGIVPEAIPSLERVADFIVQCAELHLPFKATAGLHHPVRGRYSLTYGPGAPTAVMHGFLNVFLAAAFAWRGQREICALLAETDPAAFRFDESAHWRDWSLGAEEVSNARRSFAHSFGSCSFEEPVGSLQDLGWL